MPSSFTERAPRERETLIYDTPEEADAFLESAHEQVRQQEGDARASRQVVGDKVAQEFASAGHAVDSLKTPWEHTAAEHDEAQALTNIAFSKNLGAALAAARASRTFPRNLDLFHDALTGELYQALLDHKVNRQPVFGFAALAASVVLVVAILVVLLLALT